MTDARGEERQETSDVNVRWRNTELNETSCQKDWEGTRSGQTESGKAHVALLEVRGSIESLHASLLHRATPGLWLAQQNRSIAVGSLRRTQLALDELWAIALQVDYALDRSTVLPVLST